MIVYICKCAILQQSATASEITFSCHNLLIFPKFEDQFYSSSIANGYRANSYPPNSEIELF